jgi:peptidoglycan/LPS O-acetylase OafA/YrhL
MSNEEKQSLLSPSPEDKPETSNTTKDIDVEAREVTRKVTAKVEKKPERKNLPHLTGVRTLLTMWIVIHHMSPQEPTSSISIFTMRVDVAVELFVMTTGFMTQYAYGTKDVTSSAGSLIAFYVQRLARICLTAQLAMSVCLFFSWFGGAEIITARNFGCLLFVKNLLNPDPNCPDAPTWFVAAMIPSWLLWPLLTRPLLVRSAAKSLDSILRVCVLMWLVALGPPLALCLMQDDWLSWDQVKYTWFWPLSQLGDFALGSAVAALMLKKDPPKNAAHVADLICVVLIGILLFFPIIDPAPESWTGPVFRPGHFLGFDGLSARLAAPFLAMWIYCSSAGGYSARFLAHPVLTAPGAYTLEVYLFQAPLHDLFMWIQQALDLSQASTEVFMLYLFVLWMISVMFVDFIAVPADKWLRSKTKEWPEKPLKYFLGSSSSHDGPTSSSVAPL